MDIHEAKRRLATLKSLAILAVQTVVNERAPVVTLIPTKPKQPADGADNWGDGTW